jgi:hypothetical protein
MIVAAPVMKMMQVPADKIIKMISVRRAFVAFASMIGCACISIRAADGNRVFIDMILMNVMKMTVVEIIGTPIVVYRHMSALRIVYMTMRIVFLAAGLFHCDDLQEGI